MADNKTEQAIASGAQKAGSDAGAAQPLQSGKSSTPPPKSAQVPPSQRKSQPGDQAVVAVHTRNEFYRDSHRQVLRVLLLSASVSFVAIGILLYIVLHPPAPKYFAVTADGRLIPLVALSEPNLSPPSVLQWANQAAVAAYSYNFVNWRSELQAASQFFTPNGWESFIQALSDSNNLTAIQKKRLIVSAVAQGAPVILDQGVSSMGRYYWKVQMPMLVTFQSASQISTQKIVVTMLIVRVSTLRSVRGIGIEQFVASSQ